MFLDNKYTRRYFAFIAARKTRACTKADKARLGYRGHHIIPQSLGGSDDYSNICLLTQREHFHAHILLVKMLEGKNRAKMAFALMRFGGVDCKSFIFASALISKSMCGENNPMFGRPLTEQHREKITGENHGMFGTCCYEVWVQKYGQEAADRLYDEMNTKRSKALTGSGNGMWGKKHTLERNKHHSETLTGRRYMWQNGIQRRIQPENFQKFLDDGWTFHERKSPKKIKVTI